MQVNHSQQPTQKYSWAFLLGGRSICGLTIYGIWSFGHLMTRLTCGGENIVNTALINVAFGHCACGSDIYHILVRAQGSSSQPTAVRCNLK